MNPFLNDDEIISWSSLKPEHVVPDITLGIARVKEQIENIIHHSSATYEGCFVAFEKALEELSYAWRKVTHLSSVSDSPKLRAAMNEMLPLVSDFFNGLYINNDLWEKFEQAYRAEALRSGLQRRHMDEIRTSFVQNGAELSAEKKSDLVEVNRKLAKLCKKFSDNVLDGTHAWDVIVRDENKLRGLPVSALAAAKASAQSKGEDGWRFTLTAPSYIPVLQHCENSDFRKEIWFAINGVGREEPYNNLSNVIEILGLRKKQAQLLGHQNFPDYVLSRRMAKSGSKALDFVESLHAKVQTQFVSEIESLEEWVAAYKGEEIAKLDPWDVGFYAEKKRQQLYSFDDEVLRPYFPVDSVLSGLFAVATKLYGVTISELPSRCYADGEAREEGIFEVWHDSVRAYALYDEDKTQLGLFYTDWFPRETKRGGAWMNPLRSCTQQADGSFSLNVGLIAGNMTAPIGDQPALLKHREVVTIFHEFGHLLHHLFGNVPVPTLNGTHVAWDFVELPSQIMENWCWEPAALTRFAKHHKTGEEIPAELIEKMKRAKNFHSAFAMMRQLAFGKLDLELHLSEKEFEQEHIDTQIAAFLQGYTPELSQETTSNICRFGHLFSGPVAYASGYYSYKWAEVLDADAFSRFQKEGIFNREVGQEFRDLVLSRGNSAPPEMLFASFMGREPDSEALLRRSGLMK